MLFMILLVTFGSTFFYLQAETHQAEVLLFLFLGFLVIVLLLLTVSFICFYFGSEENRIINVEKGNYSNEDEDPILKDDPRNSILIKSVISKTNHGTRYCFKLAKNIMWNVYSFVGNTFGIWEAFIQLE